MKYQKSSHRYEGLLQTTPDSESKENNTMRPGQGARRARCASPGGEWPLPPEGTALGCPWTSLLQVTSRGAHKTHAINPPSLGCVFVICRFSLSVLSLLRYFGAGTRSIFVRSLARVSPVPPQLTIFLFNVVSCSFSLSRGLFRVPLRGFPRLLHCEQFCTVLSLTFAADDRLFPLLTDRHLETNK